MTTQEMEAKINLLEKEIAELREHLFEYVRGDDPPVEKYDPKYRSRNHPVYPWAKRVIASRLLLGLNYLGLPRDERDVIPIPSPKSHDRTGNLENGENEVDGIHG